MAVYQILWGLTVIGGPIKKYSYYLVPLYCCGKPGHRFQGGYFPFKKYDERTQMAVFCI